MVNPMTADMNGFTAYCLFVAEMNGAKGMTPQELEVFGRNCYINQVTPHHLHEKMWCERIYEECDVFFNVPADPVARYLAIDLGMHKLDHEWSVPIELDCKASMLQYIGALLGDDRLLSMTAAKHDGVSVLPDPWTVKGTTSREVVKVPYTRRLYGSVKGMKESLDSKKVRYTADDLIALEAELQHGAFGVANDLKDFIINNCQPQENMTVTIGDEVFDITCNHYKNVGERMQTYELYNSSTDTYETIQHMKTVKQADLVSFRRYFMTLLIHNLDSQVANYVTEQVMNKYGWCLDIHDAWIVSPQAALDVRQWYAEKLQWVYDNRKDILINYFRSIGITAKAKTEWDKLMDKVVPVTDFTASGWAIK